jgi:hypothetical protein
VANLSDLTLLAKHWPVLFGRGLDPSSLLEAPGVLQARSGRTDHVDSKTPEIRRALSALSRLQELARAGRQREAAILAYTHVVCGPAARTSGEAYVALGVRYDRSRKPVTPARRQRLLEQGLRLYAAAVAAWGKKTLTAGCTT